MTEIKAIHIFSFGGVGSKQLFNGLKEVLGESVALHHGHQRVPPPSVPADHRVIYVFGNPMNAVISFFLRRQQVHERHGFADAPTPRLPRKDWPQLHCRKLQGDWENLSIQWELADFLAQNRDLFRLEEHFDRWSQFQASYPILYVKYETLWQHLGEIFSFLGLNPEGIKKFPAYVPRTSDWTTEPLPIQEKLRLLYGPLADKIKGFPELTIHEGHCINL